jgi:hypothetical protein
MSKQTEKPCPFSPDTHIRRDGEKILSVRIQTESELAETPYKQHIWLVEFKEYGLTYTDEGKWSPDVWEECNVDIITKQEYENTPPPVDLIHIV